MKLSAKERTGLRAMIALARRYGEGPVPLSQVAETQDLPRPYLGRIAALLRRSGLLSSVRGAHGGFLLSRTPAEIKVGDVFRAVEGALIAVDCVSSDEPSCARESYCATRDVVQTLHECLTQTLDSISLADVIARDA